MCMWRTGLVEPCVQGAGESEDADTANLQSTNSNSPLGDVVCSYCKNQT